MKQKITKTHTSDFIEWNAANGLINRIIKDGNYVMAALITCGIYFGLRISDLRKLTWAMVLNDEADTFNIHEEKTNKLRTVKVNANAKQLLTECYNGLDCPAMSQHCFISKKKQVFSTQRINVLLKDIRDRYNVKCKNISCHSLRKTFGRAIFEKACENGQGEMALIKLQSVFGHSTPQITKIYLGIKQEEILQCYDLLE